MQKYIKRYMFFLLLIVMLLLVMGIAKKGAEGTIVKKEDGYLEDRLWNPMIARYANRMPITVNVNGKTESRNVYMDSLRQIRVPVGCLQDMFDCSAHVYDNNRLVVQKNNTVVELALGSDEEASLVEQDGKFYVSVSDLAFKLNYEYVWNPDENKANITGQDENTRILPYRYSMKESGRAPAVKNQGKYGTCWAFASLTALESAIMPEENLQFSPDHMSIRNDFHMKQNDGGEYTMAMAYLTSWRGPVLEEDDPYGDNKSPENLSSVKHVQEIQILEEKDFEKIKEAVFKYGGVQSSLYTSLTNSSSKSVYYNKKTNSYCYIGTEKPNHDVVIIGWDDNYSKDNFNMELEGDGAFICQNSWGENFGDEGIFYVSYYDTNIGIHNIVYTKVENADNYDNIYQADLCGWVGRLGFGQDSAYFSNVYTVEGNETLEAVGFYATGKDTEYEISIVENFTDTGSFSNQTFLQKGYMANAGYYTVPLEKPIEVQAGQRVAVIIKIKTPNSVHPIAIEYAADKTTKDVVLDDGEGYISMYGNRWSNVETEQKCNLCLKVYSKRRE